MTEDRAGTWEYRIVIFEVGNSPGQEFKHFDAHELDDIGREGWELVSTDAIAGAPAMGLPRTTRMALWFKRPR
jgi:hypothetical protein